MRNIYWLFAFVMLQSGCEFDREPIRQVNEASSDASDAATACNDAGTLMSVHEDASMPDSWPRTHPVGTLLIDQDRELWMMTGYGFRSPVSGDDTLGLIGMNESDAIPMTSEEARCTLERDDYWIPENNGWWPVYGPFEGDPGPFVLNWISFERRPVSLEALESWGYYTRWLDWFDGGLDEWESYHYNPEPQSLRDGTLVQTESAYYYIVHARSYLFDSSDLATQAGYHIDDAMRLSESRLRELAPSAFVLTRESFNHCPADELMPRE